MHVASNTLKLAVSLSLAVTRINFVKVSQCYVYNVYYHHAADQLYVFGRVCGGGKVEYMNERELPLDLTMNHYPVMVSTATCRLMTCDDLPSHCAQVCYFSVIGLAHQTQTRIGYFGAEE